VGCSIGADGPSQMALEDIAMMRAIPNSIVLYPADGVATIALLDTMLEYTDGISYLRTTREDLPVIYEQKTTFPLGKLQVLRSTPCDVCVVIAAGITLHEALKSYELLKAQGVDITIVDLYCIKPFPTDALRKIVQKTKKIVVVEDHYKEGGLADAVTAAIQGISCQLKHLCVAEIPTSGSSSEQLRHAEIDCKAITQSILQLIAH